MRKREGFELDSMVKVLHQMIFLKAESVIIGFSQHDAFKQEMYSLQSGTSGVKRCSDIYKLDPVLIDGLLRMGGRLSRAAMPDQTKRPVILPKKTSRIQTYIATCS